jgi:hypothetical protein
MMTKLGQTLRLLVFLSCIRCNRCSKRDYIDRIKGKTTDGNQKARKHAEHCIAHQEGQAPKHTKGKQLGEQQRSQQEHSQKANKARDTAKLKELRQSLHLRRTQHLRQSRHHSTTQHTKNKQPPQTHSGTRSGGQHRSRLRMHQSQAVARRQLCISAAG